MKNLILNEGYNKKSTLFEKGYGDKIYFKGKKFIGWQYIPLRKQFENIKNNKASSKKILILSGGSNSRNFTYQILRTINHFKKRLELVILLNFKKILDNNLKKIIKSSPHKIKIIKSK